MGSEPCLGSTLELALEAWVLVSHPECRRVGELTLPPASGSTGWQSWSSAKDLDLVVQMRESQWDDQLSFYPGPDPGL